MNTTTTNHTSFSDLPQLEISYDPKTGRNRLRRLKTLCGKHTTIKHVVSFQDARYKLLLPAGLCPICINLRKRWGTW